MAIPSVSTTTYPTARFGAIGQSLAAFLYYSYAGYAFKTKFAEIMRGSGNDAIVDGGIEIAPYATGGSFASRENKDAAEAYDADAYTSSAVHWNDITGTYDTVATSARSRMLARNASNKVVHLLADQGQADSVCAAGLTAFVSPGVGPVQGADNWNNAWTNLIPGYREYLESSVTGQIAWAMLGRSLSLTDTLGYERIRQEQLALLNDNPGAIFKGLETWDVELGDSVHPSIVGQTTYGYRLAEMVARELYGVTSYTDADGATVKIYAGPTIASVSLAADNVTVTVTLASETVTGDEDTIYMPPRAGPCPCGFAFWDAAEDMDQIFSSSYPPPVQRPGGDWSWDPATKEITFTLATPITGTIAMAFPFDNVSDFNPDAVIKGSVSDKPLQSWMR
jgi:hypothetical protein